MKVLVTGGAGYIGSHMLKVLQDQNHRVVCLDNLSSGHKDLVCCDEFIEGDLADRSLLSDIFENNNFDAVVHFAAHSQVGESIKQPDKYYRNNITNTQNLLDAMVYSNVKKLCFLRRQQYLVIRNTYPLMKATHAIQSIHMVDLNC